MNHLIEHCNPGDFSTSFQCLPIKLPHQSGDSSGFSAILFFTKTSCLSLDSFQGFNVAFTMGIPCGRGIFKQRSYNSLIGSDLDILVKIRIQTINPKIAGGGIRPPRHFLLYLSRLLFFRAETSWLFFSSLALNLKPFLKKIGPRVMTRAFRNRALGPTKNWPKTDFQWKLQTNRVFLFSGYTFTMFYLIYLVYLE